MPLDALIRVIDRIISLVERRQIDREALFSEVVEPLFAELEPVAEDCFALFRAARDLSEATGSSELPEDVLADLRRLRERSYAARIKVRAMARVIARELRHKEVVIFAEDVVGFFYSAERDIDGSRAHGFPGDRPSAPAELAGWDGGPDRVGEFRAFVGGQLKRMEEQWGRLSDKYARLKLELSSPSRFRS